MCEVEGLRYIELGEKGKLYLAYITVCARNDAFLDHRSAICPEFKGC